MQQLERIHLVQFFLFEAQSLQLDSTSAIIAPNGAGKSTVINILTTLLVRRSHLFHRSARRPTRCGGSNGFGKFDVGGKVRRRTVSNGVLARIGQHVELM